MKTCTQDLFDELEAVGLIIHTGEIRGGQPVYVLAPGVADKISQAKAECHSLSWPASFVRRDT
jgi:hypothetical protein